MLALPCLAEAAHVLVVRRGWHIDVGFPVDELSPPLKSTLKDFPGTRYAFYGFGDRRYLTSKTHGVPTLLAAIWPGAGVILLTAISNEPEEAFGAQYVATLSLSESQEVELQRYLWKSFASQAEEARLLQPGPYAGSEYFHSTQRYSGVHTCNTWVAEVLRAGGFPIRRRGVIFAGQLWPKVYRLSLPAPSLATPSRATG
jgi:Protein of unknown function (DUF2459)